MMKQSTAHTKLGWYIIKYLLAGMLLGAVLSAPAQNAGEPELAMERVAGKLCKEAEENINRINKDLLHKNIRYLQNLEAREDKIKKELIKKGIDAAGLFDQAAGKYALLRKGLEAGEQTGSRLHTTYIARLDTLQAGLNFLAGTAYLHSPRMEQSLQQALGSIRELQDRFRQTEEVERWVEQRSGFLQQQLAKWGLVKDIKELQQQAYYYRAQVQQYKAVLNNPSKLETQAIRMLKRGVLFRQFFQTHSWLAALFSSPGEGDEAALVKVTDLQSRDQVAQIMAQRFGSPVQVQQLLQQQGKETGSLPGRLKILMPTSGGSGAGQLPQFQPNNQKTRRFKDRLELGTKVQTGRANRFFPSTTDIGISVGYKLNDKSVIGIGSAYRMGWGRDIRHINITHEGVGLRSFIDYNIKGNFWLSGGAELNYRSRFNHFEILNDYSAWQKSALLGVSKKYKAGSKLKGNMQLLYDFLWKQQVPRTQALQFRIGYNFK